MQSAITRRGYRAREIRVENMVRPWGCCSIDCSTVSARQPGILLGCDHNLPSGKSPVLPLCVCLPRYHPSPKSSSRSISSIRSPFVRLISSELRASKSSEYRRRQYHMRKVHCASQECISFGEPSWMQGPLTNN